MDKDPPLRSVLDAGITSCSACRQFDPAAALKALVRHASGPFVNESHFSVRVATCAQSGGLSLAGYCELTDWDEGDDAQSWFYVPLTKDELEVVTQHGSGSCGTGARFDETRKAAHIVGDHPTGGVMANRWVDGALRLMQHD